MARELRVEIVGDASSLNRAFKSAGDSSNKLGSALGSLGKVAAGGAVAGLFALGAAAKVGFGEFIESEKVIAQTNAVIKSTGGVANVTAKQVDSLAQSLSMMSGVDDEAVASGENMLLTFTKVRNEVGAGNDIFNQATRATLDLSVAMGKDMTSSAILVGKALQDPIKGMSALSRAGIQFTESQKDTIKALVDSGDAMGAQKVILKELETQFGGSAKAAGETFGGQLDRLKVAFENMAGEVVGAAIPSLTKLVGMITSEVIPRIGEFSNAISAKLKPLLRSLADLVLETWPLIKLAIQGVATVVTTIVIPAFTRLGSTVSTTVKNMRAAIEDNIPRINSIFKNLAATVDNMRAVQLPGLAFLFTTVLPAALRILIPVIQAVTAWWKLQSDAMKRLIDLYTWFGNNAVKLIKGAWGGLSGILSAMAAAFRAVADAVWAIVHAIQALIDAIHSIPSLPDIHIPHIPHFGGGGGGDNGGGGFGGQGFGDMGPGVATGGNVINLHVDNLWGANETEVRKVARMLEPHLNRGPASLRTT